MPPGFSRVGGVLQVQTSVVASPEAIFSLMTWYDESNAALELVPPQNWQDEVTLAKQKARDALNAQWKAALLNASGSLLKEDLAQFVKVDAKSLSERTDWAVLDSTIKKTQAILSTPYQITVPFEECENDVFWSKKSTYGKTDFVSWGKNRKIIVPDSPKLLRQALLDEIKAVELDLKLKKSILETLEKVSALNQQSSTVEALSLLDKTVSGLPENPLHAIADEATLALLQKHYTEQPILCIQQVLNNQNEAFQKLVTKDSPSLRQQLGILERSFSETLKKWAADPRYKESLVTTAPAIRQCAMQMHDLRLDICKYEMQVKADKQDFWGVTTFYQALRQELQEKRETDFSLYKDIAISSEDDQPMEQSLRRELRQQMVAIIPTAADYLLDIAEKASDISQRHGYALAICQMLKTMGELVGALPESSPAAVALKRAETLAAKTESLILEKNLVQTISIQDMDAATPGLGKTYTRDTANALTSLLNTFGLNKIYVLAEPGTPLSPLGYVLYNGVVADYDGTATTERNAFRTIRRWGEIKRMLNPDYVADSKQPKDVFNQEVIEQLIHVREIERQAHIRVFFNMRGPGFTTMVDVNEFYPRRFIVEESNPFTDTKVSDVIKVYDIDKLKVPDALPELKQERIWTSAEILDWARKDSLRVFSLRLLYHINQFPFYLSNRAKHLASDGDIAESIEQWANCFVLCNMLSFDEDPATKLNPDTPPVAASYEDCITALRKQRADLAELKRTVGFSMLTQANLAVTTSQKQ